MKMSGEGLGAGGRHMLPRWAPLLGLLCLGAQSCSSSTSLPDTKPAAVRSFEVTATLVYPAGTSITDIDVPLSTFPQQHTFAAVVDESDHDHPRLIVGGHGAFADVPLVRASNGELSFTDTGELADQMRSRLDVGMLLP